MEESIFGGLITFENKDKFDELVTTLDKSTAVKLIEVSINYAQNNGLFTLEESVILYNCIKKIKE